MSSRADRHHEEEEHENHERWLVTYADMVTLLMVLFIVMFAMSQVDVKKFNELKSGLAAGFGQSTSLLDGSSSLLEETGTTTVTPIAPAQSFEELEEVPMTKLSTTEQAREQTREHQAKADAEVERLDEVRSELMATLTAQGLQDDVRTSYDERGLVVSLVSKHVVFRNDRADLSERGTRVVDAIGPVLAALSEDLEISGNTNQVATKPVFYPTDWDLSSARAITVLRRLDEVLGLPSRRLSLTAYGHTRPLEDPAKPGAQDINKRVDIVVLSPSDPQTRELLSSAPGAETAPASASTPPSDTNGATS